MPEQIALIQLFRIGDVVSLLPIAKHLHDLGNEVTIVTSSEYSAILDAVSYVNVLRYDANQRDVGGAARAAERLGVSQIIKCQNESVGVQKSVGDSNFQVAQWARAGFLEKFHDLPLVFDKRDKTAEAAAIASHIPASETRPLLLTNFKSTSSPYYQTTAQRKWVSEAFGKDYFVLDLSEICFRHVSVILAFLERAEVLITVDTLTLHLAYATGTPTIAMSRFLDPNNKPSTYYNSEPRSHWVYRCSYSDSILAGPRKEMERIIRTKDYEKGRLIREAKFMRLHEIVMGSNPPTLVNDSGGIIFTRIRVDESKLAVAKWKYNPGILRVDGKLLMAYRCQNEKAGVSRVGLSWLDEQLQPMGSQVVLKLNRSAEDPRLWMRGSKLFMTTCDGIGKQYATEIKASGQVIGDHVLPHKVKSEKNYLPFEHEGRLYCIYRFPHNENIHEVWELGGTNYSIRQTWCGTKEALRWNWGEIRGSTPPVRVGDEYFTFFHSSFRDDSIFRAPVYVTGWLSFEARAPFRITAMSPRPIFWPDLETYGRGPTRALVTFACGAVHENGRWIVSAGANDAYCDLFCISHAELIKDARRIATKPETIDLPAPALVA